MITGRPKSENPKKNILALRLTDEELAAVEKLSEKLKMSKSAAILKAVKNFSQIQPVYYRVKPKKIPKFSEGITCDDD